MYKIAIEEKAMEYLRKMAKADVRHFREKVGFIAQNPYASIPYAKKMKGEDGFRFRFGNYRAIYIVMDDVLTICVVEVGHRKDVYRR